MSNIEKIKAEIERLKQMGSIGLNEYDAGFENGRGELCDELLAFIDSLPEDDPLNDPRFGEGFDAGRAVQRIFDETEEKPSEDLEKAAENIYKIPFGTRAEDFIAGAEWQKSQMPMPEDTVIFMKGVEEGRRLEREEREENKRKEDELPRFYGD